MFWMFMMLNVIVLVVPTRCWLDFFLCNSIGIVAEAGLGLALDPRNISSF
jgi:hypothetical protein